VTSADISVSIGLIFTELVINSLKHGFPDYRTGTIKVSYQSDGRSWTLAVGDEGVGMPRNTESQRAGLGTSIIQALARQLHADVRITAENPGTKTLVVGQ